MSGDCMRFPDTVEEFMEQYKVVDKEGIYMSKGAKLVPIFRMEQWFEHEKAQLSQEGTTKDTTSDPISRQAAIDAIMGEYPDAHYPDWYASKIRALPSAQSERKTGRWINKDGGLATCSVCGERWGVWSVMNYCPNCGADMRG